MEGHRLQLLENGALLKALGREREKGRNVSYWGTLLFAVVAKYCRGDQIRVYAIGGALCGKHGG